MKICTKCGVEKEDSDYYFKNKRVGRLHSQCKDCYKRNREINYAKHYAKYQGAYRHRAKIRRDALRNEHRQKMYDYFKGKSCEDCRESDIVVLELDHIDPKQKSFSISQAVRLGYKWEDVEEELKKCRVLCANCHKRRTAKQQGWYKSLEAPSRIELL